VDLDSPRERQDVGQDAGLDLRDVDRLLLLEDASLHAVVADAVAGARAHRVVDRDQGKRADRIALAAELMHLRDLFVQRAPGQRYAQEVLLEGGGLDVEETLRARVLLTLVAEEAVVGLAQDLAPVHSKVGQAEPVAPAAARSRSDSLLRNGAVGALGLNESGVVHRLGQVKGGPAPD